MPALFEPAAVLPVQFPNCVPATGIQRLMYAVLADALECVQKHAFTAQPAARRLFVDAYEWIYQGDCDWPFSFENICETLGVDPSYVRDGLGRWLGRAWSSLREASMTTESRRLETIACPFCSGRGTDPFDIMSSLSTCCVCGGRGTVRVPVPHARCAHCRGTGAIKTLTCTACGGKGVLPACGHPTMVCRDCGGSGDDSSAPAMACLRCHGRGWIALQSADARTIAQRGEEEKGRRHGQ